MKKPLNDLCGHCGLPATGNAVARVGSRNVRLCAEPTFPYESSCIELVDDLHHELDDQCWIPMRFAQAQPHHSWCVLSASRQEGMSDEMKEIIPQICHKECFGMRMALANLMLAADPWLTARQPVIGVVASRLRKLTSGQGSSLVGSLDPAVGETLEPFDPGQLRALPATETALVTMTPSGDQGV